MNLKRFTIISSIIMTLILATIITLSCIKVDNGLKIDNPSMIRIYANSSVPVEYSQEATPSKYKKALKVYNETTKLSIMDYMIAGRSLKIKPSQDIKEPPKYESWKEANKSNYFCFELIFDETQSVVVNIDGNTKVVEFTGLIMKVGKSRLGKEVALYFSTSTSDSKNYSKSPILITMDQNKLYNFIDDIAVSEEE